MSAPRPPLRSLRVYLAAALLLVAGHAALVARASDPLLPGYLTIYLSGATAPLVVVVLLLAVERRELALGWAVAFGSVFFVRVLVAEVASPGILGASAPASYGAIVARVVHAALAPVLLLLAEAALRSHRRLAPAERSPGAWRTGLACGLVAMALWSIAPWWLLVDHTRERAMRKSETAAQESLAQIARCAAAHAAAHPGQGFPATLAALGPDGARCLDGATAAGAVQGYRLTFTAGVADAAGAVHAYAACAQPIDTRASSVFTYVVDEHATPARGVPRDVAAIDAGTPLGCAATWFYDNQVERGIKHCLLEWAAAHPQAGYPTSLRAVGPEGTGCLELLGMRPVSGDAVSAFESGFEYRAVEPDAHGVVRDFTLRPKPLT